MIVVDANLLIYARSENSPHFAAAKEWLKEILSGDEPIGLPWTTIHAFLRIMTHPTLTQPPLSPVKSIELIDSWLQQPNVSILQPGAGYWPIFRRLILDTPVRGNLVMDAHVAALAVEHGGTVYTTDGDFRRFAGLRVVNPL
ncbi:MAG TPA: type II toxin-antitoxin system VapC family toxin [Thermoanaerobaculia bacterium]|nr:type II toxin-antitoxin system VapC family toxin [Thermoanaerobaculia bacterium]